MPTLNLGHVKGDTGAAAELQATATHIQWRPVGGTTWTNLVALADITGADAAVTATNIAAAIAAADAKSPPIDADEISLLDSAAAGALKRLSFGGLWTWIKAKIDLGQTWSGAHAFDSTTRPTSAGTGTPAPTSLITRADGDATYKARLGTITSGIVVDNTTTLQSVASVELPVGTWYIKAVWLLLGTANTGTKHGLSFSGSTSLVRFNRVRFGAWQPTAVIGVPFSLALTESATQAEVEGWITVTTAGTLALQAAKYTAHADNLTVGATSFIAATPA